MIRKPSECLLDYLEASLGPNVLANQDYYYDQLGFASPSGWMAWFEETIKDARTRKNCPTGSDW